MKSANSLFGLKVQTGNINHEIIATATNLRINKYPKVKQGTRGVSVFSLHARDLDKGRDPNQSYDKNPKHPQKSKKKKEMRQQKLRLHNNDGPTSKGRSVGVTTATQLVGLNRFTGPQPFLERWRRSNYKFYIYLSWISYNSKCNSLERRRLRESLLQQWCRSCATLSWDKNHCHNRLHFLVDFNLVKVTRKLFYKYIFVFYFAYFQHANFL